MKKIVLVLLVAVSSGSAQTGAGWSFVPSGLLFKPLIASQIEPRVGIMKMTGENRLRLDIGNSIDLVGYTPENERAFGMALGADFFTLTRIESERKFHFPVDAVDYLFGINASTACNTPDRIYALRLRVSHISAHMVDGHYNGSTRQWKDNRNPRVYSREFLNLVGAVTFSDLPLPLRIYAGGQYLTNVDPRNLPRFSGEWGAEISTGTLLGRTVTPYAAADFQLLKITSTTVRTSIQAGCKIGYFNGRGFDIFATYFNGMSIHGEYFDVREEYTALGVNFAF